MSIRTAIIGPTGYTGYWLIERLLGHPAARLSYLASRREEPTNIAEVFPSLLGRVPDDVADCRPIDPDAIARAADVVFLALPHRAAFGYAPQLLKAGVRVIDLSADYRLRDGDLYERVYGCEHEDKENLAEAIYGLPELYRDQLADADLVANPGCYPTAAALALAPLLSDDLIVTDSIVINAASGVTGAGRSPKQALHFPEHHDAFYPYGEIGHHRHQCEIEQSLADAAGEPVPVLFVPHLLPIDRGILETIYAQPADGVSEGDLFDVLENAYDDEPFVRVRADLPSIRHVRDTNFCDLSVRLVERDDAPSRVVVFAAEDNMLKGAAGQAIQNMNAVFGRDETEGLL
ncbi:MAG: N-acetyl-gamma-glutamyl-phosphate reductase [Phycisphaeraceae bacterium]|nr:N-acetyl-gamma-glutamyl-phosphate reductase [Phycisphaeraceae bacterium]